MALEAGCPVMPVAMIGTDKAQPTGKKVPKIMRNGVRIGKPLDFSRYEGMEDDRFVLRSITDEIMYELMLLSGQEYVDMYATSMKDRILAAAKTKARELQEAAKPGTAARELEEALDAGDDEKRVSARPSSRTRRPTSTRTPLTAPTTARCRPATAPPADRGGSPGKRRPGTGQATGQRRVRRRPGRAGVVHGNARAATSRPAAVGAQPEVVARVLEGHRRLPPHRPGLRRLLRVGAPGADQRPEVAWAVLAVLAAWTAFLVFYRGGPPASWWPSWCSPRPRSWRPDWSTATR